MASFKVFLSILGILVVAQTEALSNEALKLKLGVPLVTTLANSTILSLSIQDPLDPSHEFWIFEAHSQNDDICLSNSPVSVKVDFNVGSHSGITVRRDVNQTSPLVYLSSPLKKNVTVLLLVRGYTTNHPVPGLDVRELKLNGVLRSNPALNISWNDHTVDLQFSNAGYLDNQTVTTDWVFKYEIYQTYLDERDFDELSFITKLGGFLLPKDIRSTGHIVSESFVHRNLTSKVSSVVFGAYPGTAVVFSVIVTTSKVFPNGTEESYSSVYVASSTYSCNLDESQPMNCKVMWHTLTKVVCAVSIFVGLFIALIGHRHFQATLFFFGLVAGYFLGYILAANFTALNDDKIIGLSAGIAVIVAILWSSFWFFCGIPLFATLLPTLVLGLLFGCTIVYLPVLNLVSMTSNNTYWACIGAFLVGTPLVLLSFTRTASILSCAFVGTYAIITPIDHYIGSSLKYIMVNVVRRATVEEFKYAVTYLPFQTNDIALTFGWIGLIVISCLVQKFRERNRAPFPPNMYQLWRWRREERSLLSENAANVATESTPLLRPIASAPHQTSPENMAIRSPVRVNTAVRSVRAAVTIQTPVVGYIEGYGVSSPAYRAFQMPEFYEGRGLEAIGPTASTAATSTVTVTPLRSGTGGSIPKRSKTFEDTDIFRPPDDDGVA